MRTNPSSSARRRYYARYLTQFSKKNYTVLLLGGLFVAGVLCGALLVRTAQGGTADLLLRLMGDFARRRRDQSFTQNLVSAMHAPLGMLLIVFLSGFCAIGQPVPVLIPLMRGLGFGFSAALLYANHGFSAAGYVGLLVLPGMMVSTIGLLFCCREALRLSGSLWSALQGDQAQGYPAKLYCARFIAALLLCLLAAFVEALLYAVFSGLILPV